MKATLLVVTISLGIADAAVAQLTGGWRQVPAPWHPAFGSNARYDFAYDAVRSECVLIRAWGNFGANIAIDTWDGSHWHTQSTPQSPGAPATYQFQAAAHDPVRDRLVLIDYLGATWEWDRAQWTIAPATPFGPRELDLCWDAGAQRIVTVLPSGIHQWDGTSWTPVAGSALPQSSPYSSGLQIARDETRNVLIACGVRQFGGPLTLVWDGASWHFAATAPRPTRTGTKIPSPASPFPAGSSASAPARSPA
ncbi:MAG TPA: hypothetical protein ENI87_08820, partial [bacterium]|nr:hypothetical protein [bacterium]